jgi:hypothetical protein
VSEEKPNFKRRDPDNMIPGQSRPVSAEELGARVVPDPEGTVFSSADDQKGEGEKTQVARGPDAVASGQPESLPHSSVPPATANTPSFSGADPARPTPVPERGAVFPSEPRPISFTPRVDETPTTFQDEEEEEKGSSAALLIAIAALLLSILGILIAAGLIPFGPSTDLIGQDRLADNSVGEVQIQDEAVALNKINPDIIEKLRGEKGPAGKQGERGPAGPAGSGLADIQIRSKEVRGTSTSSRASALVVCSAGEILLSGGAAVSGAAGKVAIVASNPSQENNAWFAESARIDPENNDSWTLTVYARCGKKTNSNKQQGEQ